MQIKYCLIRSPLGYQKTLLFGACCTEKGRTERCYCKADVSFCKAVCDSDPKCKGYAKGNRPWQNGVSNPGYPVCDIATTSTCPSTNSCKKLNLGENLTGNLQEDIGCGGPDFYGCFIKLEGGLVDTANI